MMENEAKGFIQGKVDCMKKCDVFECKGTDECDSCNYCYSQGTFGEQKKAFEMAIQALEEIKQIKEVIEDFGLDCGSTVSDIKEILYQLKGYLKIGTIEEFKALKENQCKCEDCAGCTNWLCDCANERANAIDEFAERLKQRVSRHYVDCDAYFGGIAEEILYADYIDDIAEEMRGTK